MPHRTPELNDAPLMRHHYEGDHYAKICKAQFDQLYREGAENGRLMCIAFHPYVMGFDEQLPDGMVLHQQALTETACAFG